MYLDFDLKVMVLTHAYYVTQIMLIGPILSHIMLTNTTKY